MGTCLSKKKQSRHHEPSHTSSNQQTNQNNPEMVKEVVVETSSRSVAAAKKPVFVIAQTKKASSSCSVTTAAATDKSSCFTEDEESSKWVETPKKKRIATKDDGDKSIVEEAPPATVQTLSCTKEEVDAILIQCGRLSRSSSATGGPAVAETPTKKRYSGSKRSYDFDEAAKRFDEDDDYEKQPVSRPSPRRRTPSRDRAGGADHHHQHQKRSGSRERGSSGSHGARRASQSPRRRSEVISDQRSSKQPGKMVSVPAREKKNGISGEATVAKRASSPAVVRSHSPAHTRASNENSCYPQSLSRNNSRKAEQSPYRRNPMAELDENSLRHHKLHHQKASESSDQPRKQLEQRATEIRKHTSCQVKEHPEEAPPLGGGSGGATEGNLNPIAIVRSRSSRRSSRDLDHILGINNTAFSLPACVSKACSILEAVADLNFDSKSVDTFNDVHLPFLESEIFVKDDIMEPSIQRYVTVGGLLGDLEPQESAGSNSFVAGGGQTWSSPWEPNSVESGERCWTSSQSANEVVEEEEKSSLRDHRQPSLQESRGRRKRGGGGSSSSTNSSLPAGSATRRSQRREFHHHRSGGGAARTGERVSGRVSAVPVAAGASS